MFLFFVPKRNEAPIGAAIVDAQGEVIGAGHAKIVTSNDPSLVAAMSVHRLTKLLTFNDRDFKRFTEIIVVSPQNIT